MVVISDVTGGAKGGARPSSKGAYRRASQLKKINQSNGGGQWGGHGMNEGQWTPAPPPPHSYATGCYKHRFLSEIHEYCQLKIEHSESQMTIRHQRNLKILT